MEELRLTVNPPEGAGPDNVRVRFCTTFPLIVNEDGVKLIVSGKLTFTVALAFEKPDADAVTFALPLAVPGVTVTLALVAPEAIVTLFATEATLSYCSLS